MAKGKLLQMKPTAEIDARRELVDEFGAIEQRLAMAKPDEDRRSVLKSEIDGWYDGAPADMPQAIAGKLFQVQLSTKRNERTVVNKRKIFDALKKRLGLDGLIAVIEIPLAVIDKNLTADERKGLIEQERSGYRTYTTVALTDAGYKQAA